jgi:hypothetical protein
MDVAATVRVKSAGGPNDKPDRARLERAAALLKDQGFVIQRLGRYGVSIVGKGEDFHRALGVKPEPGKALSGPVAPRDPELRELIDLIEVVPKPENY